jgi:hypothetical protein
VALATPHLKCGGAKKCNETIILFSRAKEISILKTKFDCFFFINIIIIKVLMLK